MASSRDRILGRLRAGAVPFEKVEPVGDYLPVTPLPDTSPEALTARFAEQARKLLCEVHECRGEAEALQVILKLIGADRQVMAWDLANIPLPGLGQSLEASGVTLSGARDETVRVGITGVDAALASTGTLVQVSAPGQPRLPSLLPPVHVAVVRVEQIIPDFETWVADWRAEGLEGFRALSSVMLISGPSRTADIAMQTTMGMHGPGKLHVVLLL